MNRHKRKKFGSSKEKPSLVGYSGKIEYDGRLLPLQTTRKYKRWLEQGKIARDEKICQISQMSEAYKNMSILIQSLRKEDENNVNQSLVMELTDEMRTLSQEIFHLKSKLGIPLDRDTLNGLLENCTVNNGKRSTSDYAPYHRAKMVTDKEETLSNNSQSKARRAVDNTPPFASSLPGSVESEINVRDKNSIIRTVKIDLFSSGENLQSILESQFGWRRNEYRVYFRKRQVDKERSLFDQNIFHGTTVRANIEFKEQRNLVADIKQNDSLLEDDATEFNSRNEMTDEKESVLQNARSQVLIRDRNSNLRSINIDLSASGGDLMLALCTEFGEEISNFDVSFGSTKVDLTIPLLYQGFTHGSTIDLDAKFHGGMENQDMASSNVVEKASENSGTPEKWTKLQVANWIDSVCEDFEIDREEVTGLKRLNGKGLDTLDEEHWLRRSPNQGDLLYKLWKQLKVNKSSDLGETQKQEVVAEEMKPVTSVEEKENSSADVVPARHEPSVEEKPFSDDLVPKGHEPSADEKPSVDDVVPIGPEPSVEEKPSSADVVLTGDEPSVEKPSSAGVVPTGHEYSSNPDKDFERTESCIFAKVEDFKQLSAVTLSQLVQKVVSLPADGDVIYISGICRDSPPREQGPYSLILYDDTLHSLSVEGEVRIDVKTNTTRKFLHPDFVEKELMKIESGTHVAVKGRVTKVNLESVPASVSLQVVVDSEHHSLVYDEKECNISPSGFEQPLQHLDADRSLVYVEKEDMSSLAEEPSQQIGLDDEIYPAQVDGVLLSVNSKINKTNRRVFCSATASEKEIKKYVVALKNSFDGDIFVGVKGDGVVSGKKLEQGDLVKWRERMSEMIGGILPGSNDRVSFCKTYEEAVSKMGKECFIAIMKLTGSLEKVIIWIHVPKGRETIYFSKAKNVPAFVRIGAQTKRMTDYKDLFSLLESLKYRRIRPSQDFNQVYQEACSNMLGKHPYKLFKTKKSESHELEFKMVFSQDPVKKIAEEYVADYCCGFLNSHSGTIYFGVQEDVDTKEGHIVGLVLSEEERQELLRRSIKVLQDFYPPVDFSQISITFNTVTVLLSNVLRYQDGKVVILQGSVEKIGSKWPAFIKSKMPNILARVIRISSNCFCIVVENLNLVSGNFIDIVKDFISNFKQFLLKSIDEKELLTILDDLCVVEIVVEESQYPVHLTGPLDTHVFNSRGELSSLSAEELVRRFKIKHDFDIGKFLEDVNNFDPAGSSYIMISSPFNLLPHEQDLYGLVIPKWTLAIDFDQDPKEKGHFFQIFEKLHDRYHKERDRCLVTPQCDSLDLNADHGVCWLAARGHRDIADSLSQENEGKNTWNTTHRKMISSLLDGELTRNVMPSKIYVIVFWDEGFKNLLYSLNLLLADILSICDNTSVTFVCSTSGAYSDIDENVVKGLKENCTISNECGVHVAPPHNLAKLLACSLPETFRPEDDYQVPKKHTENTSLVIVPTKLPQRLRQNIHGRLKMMYVNKSRIVDEKSLEEERNNFYTGSQITMLGLRGNIGIKREKLKKLEQAFKDLHSVKKSRVSLIIVKADRGAGTTTMCLQFLYQHHEKIPSAQLIEIHRDLLSSIETINTITNLPLLLLVDEEVGNTQEFLDFKKEAESRRNVNIIFLLVEPVQQPDRKPIAVGRQGKPKRLRRFGDSSLYGTSCYQEITLKRELEQVEFEKLSGELLKICPDEAKDKLRDLRNQAVFEKGRALRSFAYFSLTAFGKEFSGLPQYVQFRLQLATPLQKDLLAFLSLTHVFTGFKLPASALARLLNKDKVSMKSEFSNDYLREMLSPPVHETDSRRISFLEVAREILLQLSEDEHNNVEIENGGDNYWSYIKHIAVKMAREVLSVNIGASRIDRLTRKLFVISEYESEKFSSLIRSMRNDENADTARDTLLELVEVFRKHVSFRAHLLAHLAKYYMIEYKDFKNAKPRIEEALKDLPNDALLHHIHGDIIRHHIDKLKNEETVNMQEIVLLAIESSACFREVRERRPHMNHGYASDALVQITVMQASIKSVGSDKENYGFVEYLIEMIDRAKGSNNLGEEEKYLLALITNAHEYMNESSIEYEYKENLKRKFNECIPKITALKTFCDKLKLEKKNFSRRKAWIDEVINRTNSLFLMLEIENTKDMSPEDFELRIREIECAKDEGSMKYWFRNVRYLRSVPSLSEVEKRVKQWIAHTKKANKISPHAEFYNYVVAVLIAIKDPSDRQKGEKAAELVSKQQRYKSTRNEVRTLEWLCPKQGSHVNSIDSLLHSDDLLKEGSIKGKQIPLKDKFENCLRKMNVIRWEGVVKKIKSDWQGTITFRRYIDVHFVPQSIRKSRPALGDTVLFHLSFDWHGPRAWSVVRYADSNPSRNLSYLSDSNQSPDSNSDDDNEEQMSISVPPPLHETNMEEDESEQSSWNYFVNEKMNGVVVAVQEGYGFISHPNLEDNLWFSFRELHRSIQRIRQHMVLSFRVGVKNGQLCARDIGLPQDSEIDPMIKKYKSHLESQSEETKPKSRVTESEKCHRWKETACEVQDYFHLGNNSYTTGYIKRFYEDRGFGFIVQDDKPQDVFFHQSELMHDVIPSKGTRVRFRLSTNERGFIAEDIDTEEESGW